MFIGCLDIVHRRLGMEDPENSNNYIKDRQQQGAHFAFILPRYIFY